MLEGERRPPGWTRFTNALNSILWEAPLPRRLQAAVSPFVYRNPPMPIGRVIETIAALEAAGVKTALVGGWGIDALLGRQLRPHRDLDLLLDASQLIEAPPVLRSLGYREWHRDGSPEPIGEVKICAAEAYRDRAMRVVELHGAELDCLDLAEGTIGELRVRCISAEAQLHAQAQIGKAWTWDRRTRRRMNVEAAEAAMHHSSAEAATER